MDRAEYRKLIGKITNRAESQRDAKALADAFELVKAYDEETKLSVFDDDGSEIFLADGSLGGLDAHEMSRRIRRIAERMIAEGNAYLSTLSEIEIESLFFDAPYDFDAFCRYIESEREVDRQFYLPRRKQLYPIARSLQDLEMGRLKLLGVSLPPGTGKSTLAIFYICFTSGRHPEMQSLIGSHNIEFVRGVYDEILRILSPKGEYLWHRVFPGVPLSGTNAKDLRIDLGKRKRFQTIELVSIKSGLAGKVRCTNVLYCDDLVEDDAQALNRDRMDALYRSYVVNLKQRELGNAVKELHISTRWSVHDVLGRLEATFSGQPGYKFINIPIEDEDTLRPNFDYPYGLGYDAEKIAELKKSYEDAPHMLRALYYGQPVEFEGLLYPEEELQYYFELPDTEPDAILAVCDTKTTGSDYCAMPILYQYGDKYYVEDAVCENYGPDKVEVSVTNMLLKHNVHAAQFESNVAGGRMARAVQEAIDEAGGRTHITTKWTQANKETKIQNAAPWVKKRCIFKDKSVIKGAEWAEYRLMMRMLTQYTLAGKNKHDDVPDVFAQLANYADRRAGAKLKLEKRWF